MLHKILCVEDDLLIDHMRVHPDVVSVEGNNTGCERNLMKTELYNPSSDHLRPVVLGSVVRAHGVLTLVDSKTHQVQYQTKR